MNSYGRFSEIEDLIDSELVSRDRDEKILKKVLIRAIDRGRRKQDIKRAYKLSRSFAVLVSGFMTPCEESFAPSKKNGYQVARSEKLDGLTAQYRRWKEEYPELLVMSYGPVHKVIKERLKATLANSPMESDWREFFDEMPVGSRGKRGSTHRE